MRSYLLLDKLNNFILMCFNFLSRVYFFLNPKIKRIVGYNRNIQPRKDVCYILGNGPSLNNVNFDLLKDKDTMTVNWFYRNETSFQSTYFLAIDNAFYRDEGKAYIEELYNTRPKMQMFLRYSAWKENPSAWDLSRVHFLFAKQFQYGDYVSCDFTKNMTASINVINQCIQVAISMGYKTIYLLGCDFNAYAKLSIEHYGTDYPTGTARGDSMGEDARWSSMVHYHHYALHKYASGKGVKIINLTPGSLLDAYPRDTLENVLIG